MEPNEQTTNTTVKSSFIEQLYIRCSIVPLLFLSLSYIAASRAEAWEGTAAAQAVLISFLLSIVLGIPGMILVIRRKLRNEPVRLLIGATLLSFSIAIFFILTVIGRKLYASFGW